MATENWKDEPAAEDYPGAKSYLSLLVGSKSAAKLVKALRKQEGLTRFAATDILRASGLPLLGPEDSEVAADLKKVKLGEKLSPVLLIQGSPFVGGGRISPRLCQLPLERED